MPKTKKGYSASPPPFQPRCPIPNQSLLGLSPPCAATPTATAPAGEPLRWRPSRSPPPSPLLGSSCAGHGLRLCCGPRLLPFHLPSSDDSDDAKPFRSPPTSGQTFPPPQQHQQRPQWWQLERDCNVAMKALARAGEVDQVLALFTELRASRAGSDGASPPNVLCYNTLVNALAEAGRVEEAHHAFDEMLAAGVAPNASSSTSLSSCIRGDLRGLTSRTR
ncbi:hypothetical protein ZWY2020_058521 [Hordeum vulgare]|nr:hypothetical protein ZWY2020_058521 [Hordeum vulgare]